MLGMAHQLRAAQSLNKGRDQRASGLVHHDLRLTLLLGAPWRLGDGGSRLMLIQGLSDLQFKIASIRLFSVTTAENLRQVLNFNRKDPNGWRRK